MKTEAGKATETVRLIDWANPLANDFAIAEEVTLRGGLGGHERRPDLVLYVNGIAVGVVELKNSRTSIGNGIRQNLSGPWSNAGRQLAYTSTRRTRKDTDLYIVDPAEPTGDRLVAQVEGGGWAPLDWSPDDQRLLVVNYVSVTESYLWRVDVAKGEKTLLTEKTEAPVSWTGGSFTADGKAVITTSDQGSDFKRLVRIEVADGKATSLTAELGWDVEAFAVSHDRKRLAAVINEGGRLRLQLHELPGGEVNFNHERNSYDDPNDGKRGHV